MAGTSWLSFLSLFALFRVISPAQDCWPPGSPILGVKQVGVAHSGEHEIPIEIGYADGLLGHGVELTNATADLLGGSDPAELEVPDVTWTIHNGATRPVSAVVVTVQNWHKNAQGKADYQSMTMPHDYWLSALTRHFHGAQDKSLLLPGETREERPHAIAWSSVKPAKVRFVLSYLEFDDGNQFGEQYELSLSGGERAIMLTALEKLVRAHDAGVPDAELFRSVIASRGHAELAKSGGGIQDMRTAEVQNSIIRLQHSRIDIRALLATARETINDWHMRGVLEKRAKLDHLMNTGSCQ